MVLIMQNDSNYHQRETISGKIVSFFLEGK